MFKLSQLVISLLLLVIFYTWQHRGLIPPILADHAHSFMHWALFPVFKGNILILNTQVALSLARISASKTANIQAIITSHHRRHRIILNTYRAIFLALQIR